MTTEGDESKQSNSQELLLKILTWEAVIALACVASSYATRIQTYNSAYEEGFKDGYNQCKDETLKKELHD